MKNSCTKLLVLRKFFVTLQQIFAMAEKRKV